MGPEEESAHADVGDTEGIFDAAEGVVVVAVAVGSWVGGGV